MSKKIRILLITAWPPTQFHAGGQRQLDLYQYLKLSGKFELFLYSREIDAISNQIDQRILDETFECVYWSKEIDLTGSELRNLCGDQRFDIIDFQHLQSTIAIRSFQGIAKKIIYTPMESEIRNFAIKLKKPLFEFTALKLAIREIFAIKGSSKVVAVSSSDSKHLKLFGGKKIEKLETPIPGSFLPSENRQQRVEFSHRNGVVFVAYFGSQTNLDALNWYITNVHMVLIKEAPDVKLSVVGDKSETLKEQYSELNIDFIGRVENIIPYVSMARVGISPAISGSGFRGKINQYSILNVPTVAHPLAASGLNYPEGSILLCNSGKEWVAAIKELYFNETYNLNVANSAYKHASSFKLENQQETILRIYSA
jgi:glycosyltransferase involved in cell wall biosynthesis